MNNSRRLIDANELLFDLGDEPFNWTDTPEEIQACNDYDSFVRLIESATTIDAEPVRHGSWVRPFINKYGHPCHCCSECGFEASQQDKNYCPDCGAKMDGGIYSEA